jgi:hypothetical protein
MPANCADIHARGGEAPIVVGTESSSGISGDEIHKGSLLWLLTRLSARSRMSSARATGFRGPKPRRLSASPLGSEIDIGASRAAWNNTVQANSDDPSMTGMFRTAYLPVITATSRQARERTPNEPPARPLRLT